MFFKMLVLDYVRGLPRVPWKPSKQFYHLIWASKLKNVEKPYKHLKVLMGSGRLSGMAWLGLWSCLWGS